MLKIQYISLPVGNRLKHEISTYVNMKGISGVPSMRKNGVSDSCCYLVMPRVDPSLNDLFHAARKLNSRTVAEIGCRLVSRHTFWILLINEPMWFDPKLVCLRDIHDKNILHGDIKPGHILLGRSRKPSIYLVDFSISTFWKLDDTGSHRSPQAGCGLLSAPEYASIHAHAGEQVVRRDDIECLGHTVIHLLRGDFPWINQPRSSDCHWVRNQKVLWGQSLCSGLPLLFGRFLNYARGLQFEDRPDYERWIRIFDDLSRLYPGESLSDAIERHLPDHFKLSQ